MTPSMTPSRYDFYEVVAVTKASVKILPIAKTYVANHGGGSATVMPVKGSFVGEHKPMTKRFRPNEGGYSVKITDYSWARSWDGSPEHESGDH